MEEADVLGDRIAIMAEGRVQCYGSTLFLKRQVRNCARFFSDACIYRNAFSEGLVECVFLSDL